MRPATKRIINDKIKYDSLIPKLTLFKGKAYIHIFKKDGKGHVFVPVTVLKNVHTNEYSIKHVDIGTISDSALRKISGLQPLNGLFNVVEEWKDVAFQVHDTEKRTKYTWRKYSNKERVVRVVIDSCRY